MIKNKGGFMNEYITLTKENIDDEHICCAIGDPKHQDTKNAQTTTQLHSSHMLIK